jgi:hypothetical protein
MPLSQNVSRSGSQAELDQLASIDLDEQPEMSGKKKKRIIKKVIKKKGG